jgi:hypothetical protein
MSEAILNDIHKTLKEQLKWTRFIGVRQLKAVFDEMINKDDEKLVYELSDGEKSTRDIERLTNVGRTTVARLWDKWYKMGLMERSEKYGGGRMKHSFSLADAGIEVPALRAEQPQQAPQPDGEST